MISGRSQQDHVADENDLNSLSGGYMALDRYDVRLISGRSVRIKPSAIQVVNVPPTIHVIGAILTAQLRIGIVNYARAPDVWREARGIPGDGLRVGW